MKDIINVYKKIPEKNKFVIFGIAALITNSFYFIFKVVVGIIFNAPILIAMAIYNMIIAIVKANCSKGLLNNKDEYKDTKTYIQNGIILTISSIFYITYAVFLSIFESNTKFHMIIAIAIAAFACFDITKSIISLIKFTGRTMIVKQYKLVNLAKAFNNIVLAQIAILSFTTDYNTYQYNSILGVIVGTIILGIGLYLVINGFMHLRVYTTGITNKKQRKK